MMRAAAVGISLSAKAARCTVLATTRRRLRPHVGPIAVVVERYGGARSFSSAVPVVTPHHENLPTRLIDFEVSAKIEGEESQIVTIQLSPGETVRAESGSMIYMTDGIEMDTNLGGSGATGAFKRMLTGQNVFLTDFTYNPPETTATTSSASSTGTVALGTDFPAKIIRLNLDELPEHTLICQRGAYLASNPGVTIEMEFTKNLTTGFFGGQGFILQRLTGSGDVLVKGGGTIVVQDLAPGETLRVTSGSIVAFERTVQYDVQMMPGIKNAMFGGEGLFITALTGPGRVWLQGMPADRMIAEIARRVPAGGGFGLGIPIGGGGGGGGGTVDGPGTSDGGTAVGAAGADEAAAAGSSEAAVAAADASVEADRAATVATSGGGGAIDADSPSALYGDAVPDNMATAPSKTNPDWNDESDSFSSSPSTTATETTFTDDDLSSNKDFDEPKFEDEQFPEEGMFDDPTATEGLTSEIPSPEQATSFLRSIWDFFTNDE